MKTDGGYDPGAGNMPCALIVDDSRAVRRQVQDLLIGAGYRVITAGDGGKGIDAVREDHPDVVLLDVEMPGMNGYEVLDVLNREPRLYSVILFTYRTGLENTIEGLNKGADDYLTKPIAPSELIARVRAAARTAELKKALAQARDAADAALRKLHEAQDKLIEEQKIAALARLAAGLAHRVNNPLGFVRSNIGTLRKYINTLIEGLDRLFAFSASSLSQERIRDEMLLWMNVSRLELIRRDTGPLLSETLERVDRIAMLIRSLLKVNEVGSCTTTSVDDINKIVERLRDRFSLFLPPGVSCAASLSAEPLLLSCNGEQISMSLYNILDNARDAVGEKGEIAVRVYRDAEWACVEIRDSGKGISPNELRDVSEPFFTTKDSVGNVGLGLTISQCLVQAHGGKIDMRSEDHLGTQVVVRLPLSAER